jgi:hypothetical protein
VHLDAAALERLTAWIDRYRLIAESAYRRLDALLAEASTHPAPTAGAPTTTPLADTPSTTQGKKEKKS